MLRELARSYLTTTKDLTRVMSRLKAVLCRIPDYAASVHRETGKHANVQ
jgi:hypothetical protein